MTVYKKTFQPNPLREGVVTIEHGLDTMDIASVVVWAKEPGGSRELDKWNLASSVKVKILDRNRLELDFLGSFAGRHLFRVLVTSA